MQCGSTISDQILDALEIAIDYSSFLKAAHYQRANISISTHGRRVAQSFRCFFNGCDQSTSYAGSFSVHFCGGAGERAGTNQSPSPGAKIFGAEIPSCVFSNIGIDVTALDVNEFAFLVLILEYVARRMAQQLSHYPRNASIAKLAMGLFA